MPAPTIAGAILTGGRARRLGGVDKSRLVVANAPSGPHTHGDDRTSRTIIVRQVDLLQRIAARVLVVTTAADRAARPERFADLPVTVVTDIVDDAGAVGGIHAALSAATAERVLVVAGDMPWLTTDALATLADVPAGADGRWVVSPRGPEPLLACYRRRALGRLTRWLHDGGRRASDLGTVLVLDALTGAALEALDPEGRLTTNVNTPEDLRRVQSTVA